MSTATVQMHKVVWESGMTKHSAYSEVAESAVLALKIPTSLNLQKKILCLHPQHRTYMWETQFYLRVYIRSIQWLWGWGRTMQKSWSPWGPHGRWRHGTLEIRSYNSLFEKKNNSLWEFRDRASFMCFERLSLSINYGMSLGKCKYLK